MVRDDILDTAGQKGYVFLTVQRVTAIGKPEVPDGQICLFEHMRNVVVLPTVGQ